MAISSTGRFSFASTSSAWEAQESWRARRREMAQSYLSDASALRSALATAASNQIDGLASLATQAAVTRIQKRLAAKSQSLNLTA
jgi:hypothetical protein